MILFNGNKHYLDTKTLIKTLILVRVHQQQSPYFSETQLSDINCCSDENMKTFTSLTGKYGRVKIVYILHQ